MTSIRRLLLNTASVAAFAASAALASSPAFAADFMLSGAIKSAAGEKMGGVTISAKADGSTITTSVLSDPNGEYYFPPLPQGKYRVWAQAWTFDTAKSDVDLSVKKKQDFTLAPMKGDVAHTLPGDMLLDGLPANTDEEARLKRLVLNNCTGCHTASYTLQHRFDEAGWNAILELMKRVNVGGIPQPPERPFNFPIDSHQKQLAAYLAKARGPGETSKKINVRPRPTGEAARVVFRQYDVPVNGDMGTPERTDVIDGTDWSQGTPSTIGNTIHDAWADLDGNLWFTSNSAQRKFTLGRVDAKSGEVKAVRANGINGLAVNAHGMTRDPNGILWFNTGPTAPGGKGGLARVDPKTEKIEIFTPGDGMMGTGGAVTVDYDGKGNIWASAAEGALRFDPKAEKFTEYKSVTFKTPNGNGTTYGAAADRDGNGWWAEMSIDVIGWGNGQTGKSSEIRLQPVKAELQRITPQEEAGYSKMVAPDFNTPFPWSQGPRRMGTDKNADVLWVGNSWGGNLARIDTKTGEVSYVPLPNPNAQQPYHVAVDSKHNAWTNLWTTDQVMRYDPEKKEWTAFDLPTRGTETRYISLLEKDGKMNVVMPFYRPNKLAVMTLRSEAELADLKKQAD